MRRETPQQAAHRLAKRLLVKGFIPQALHEYQTIEGEALYWRIRLKHPQSQEKWIRPMFCQGGEFRLGEPGFREGKPLYRLPELIRAKEATVWVVEGEWCADQLAKKGLVVTTSGGAESAGTADWSVLSGRSVVIWPDLDEAGVRYAQVVTLQLLARDCQVQWVATDRLALPEKGDGVDWLAAHPNASLKRLEELPKISPVVEREKRPCALEASAGTFTREGMSEWSQPMFIQDGSGVFYRASKEVTLKICSALVVEALVRDELSENWGRLLAFEDADGAWHRFAMPMEMLKGSGEELRGELLRQGLEIAAGGKIRGLLTEYIMTAKPLARARCVNRVGWYGNVFVLPEQTLGETPEQVIYQAPLPVKDYQTAGTLADWQRQVALPCQGNSRLVLVLSCAFAGMLLHPAGMESGGLHLVGESSTGKTTALRVAASVYGSPNYVNRWRATTNGLEALATLRSDTLLILDELAQIEPKDAGEAAYLLANGSGKLRAGRSGGARACQTWRVLFLSAGEIGLTEHMQAAGKKSLVGQEVRLVDLPADAGAGFGVFETLHDKPHAGALSQSLVEAASRYYGTAARAFLEAITVPEAIRGLPLRIRELQQAFLAEQLPSDASGQVHRVCERFGFIAAAGELASYYGITGWQRGEATKAARIGFYAWLEHRGHTGNQEHLTIVKHIQAFFEAHGASRFEEMQARQEQRVINRVGFKRTNAQGEHEYLVLPEMFRREMCQGFNPQLATRVLVNAGMLQPSSEGKPLTPQRFGADGVKKCYHFIRTEPLY